MKHIFQIFRHDVQGICNHFLALVIAIGLCVLPALYAWLNIYSNWDPYSNTGQLEIAVVNLDSGFTSDDGERINLGNSVVEELRNNDSIGWFFLDNKEEAIDGVRSGRFYAAISFEESFSADMYNGIFESGVRPTLNYYVNGKKNAIATKITDTAVSTLENSINEKYIQIVTEKVFTELNLIADEITDEHTADKAIIDLHNLRDNLMAYDSVLASFLDAGTILDQVSASSKEGLAMAQEHLNQAENQLTNAGTELDAEVDSFENFSVKLDGELLDGQSRLNTLLVQLREAKLEQDADAMRDDLHDIANTASGLLASLDRITSLLTRLGMPEKGDAAENIKAAINTSEEVKALHNIRNTVRAVKEETERLSAAVDAGGYKQVAEVNLTDIIKTLEQNKNLYDGQVYGSVHNMLDGMGDSLEKCGELVTAMSALVRDTDQVLESAMGTQQALTVSMRMLRTVIERGVSRIDALLSAVEQAQGDEKVQMLNRFLHSDAEVLGNFFKEPVQMEENYIYPMMNYGSGVAPFYTVLSIWVGMTILSSLIVIRPEVNCYPGAKMWELYFGRYLLFMVMSLIQTAIIVAGDLYFFHIQCLHPGLFWLAAMATSITVSLLVYTLALSFGDVGKALCIIIMVIQIAGSGGTFPIEALPQFFQNVYMFFPFPYAIDAMRECVGGMYGNFYWLCLARLGAFCVASLLVGLVIRVPFIGLFDFFEERMEETDMM